jgi:hypothetical protein
MRKKRFSGCKEVLRAFSAFPSYHSTRKKTKKKIKIGCNRISCMTIDNSAVRNGIYGKVDCLGKIKYKKNIAVKVDEKERIKCEKS